MWGLEGVCGVCGVRGVYSELHYLCNYFHCELVLIVHNLCECFNLWYMLWFVKYNAEVRLGW